MATLKKFVLGKDVTLVKFWGQTINGSTFALSDATVSGTSPVTVTTLKRGLQDTIRPMEEEINGDDSTVANHVTVADDPTFKIDVLLVNNGTDPEPLKKLLLAYEYIRYEYTLGTGSSARTTTGIRKRGEYVTNSTGRGAAMGTLELVSADVGDAPITYS